VSPAVRISILMLRARLSPVRVNDIKSINHEPG
jgi:hypothetical protein